jgi:hypothetical protein
MELEAQAGMLPIDGVVRVTGLLIWLMRVTASTSVVPSEDLVYPMLDMSIGEAAVPSGRSPQFTQEHSATKKVPLQAGGYKNFVTIGAGLSPK